METTERWYDQQPDIVTQNSDITLIRDMVIQTDRQITEKAPNIFVIDKKFTKYMNTDKAVSDRNNSMKNYREIVNVQEPGNRD